MFGKLIGIFKKKNKMSFSDKSLEEIESGLKNSNFQWIKGENLGMVESFHSVSQDGDSKFVNFKGGNRIKLDVLKEFMDIFPATPIVFDSGLPSTNNTSPSSPPVTQGKGKVNSINYGDPVSGVEESPIYKLLRKQKPNWVNVNISLKLNLPTKSLYNVLITSFEDAENEIASYVTEGIEIEDIKQAIAESIKSSFYESKKPAPQNKKQPQNLLEDDEISNP